MKKNPLFPKLNGLMHGGDYNPEQWLDRPDILAKDIELMKEAGMNCATLGVFSWSSLEPEEGNYQLDWLEGIINSLYQNGIYTILATPSGARPAWLDEKYPECRRIDVRGLREHHGMRENHCMTSPLFREKVKAIDTKLAERFAQHPGVLLWHISNEFGGECYCDLCKKKFQNWLADRYDHDIEKLNKAWWTTFWSHHFNSFDQIEPPYDNGEHSIIGMLVDWRRFTSWNTTDFMKSEIETLRPYNPGLPFTTNYMDLFDGVDYHEMSKELDYISWDSYPTLHNDYESLSKTFVHQAFNHALFRSMKPGQPFMMMESAPGLVNWQPVNKYRRPGFHRLASIQALASGSDTVQYFQWRKSRGSFEQFHGAVVDHLGTDNTRVFREVARMGSDLRKISEIAGSVSDNKVALLYDWDNRWAIDYVKALSQDSKKFDDTCLDLWGQLLSMRVDADVISSDADWSSYKVIIAPMLFLLHDGMGAKIKEFVSKGGQFLATYFTGCVDKSVLAHLGGFPGDGLTEVFGILAEETDSLYPSDRNIIAFTDGSKAQVYDYQELIRVTTADTLATYKGDYLEGRAAITRNTYGQGKAYYVSCRTQASSLAELFAEILDNAGIAYMELPDGIEYHSRHGEGMRYDFFLNYNDEPVTLPYCGGRNLLTGQAITEPITLAARDAAIIQREE